MRPTIQDPPVVELKTEEDWTRAIAAEGPVLVAFGASWCGPCRVMVPVLERLQALQAFSGAKSCRVHKVDVSTLPKIAASLKVASVPTLVLFRAGAVVERHTGSATLAQLLAIVGRAI